jgi:hypothetical protein
MNSTRSKWLALIVFILPLVTIFAQVANAEQAFNITRSSANGIQLHFTLPAWEMENVSKNGENLQRVKVKDTPYIFIDETETLPVFTTMIAIPYSGGASLNVSSFNSQSQVLTKADFDAALLQERNSGKYTATMYPERNATISEPQVIRDYRVVAINVYPFQYDQNSKKLIVNQTMDIQINYNSLPSVNEISAPKQISRTFESIYSGLILNYADTITRDTVFKSPVMLVIYGNYTDATYLAKVNEFINWKKQKGYIVNSASTATAGTSYTSIKTYIQGQYDNLNTRPDYVVLIGDESGTIAVPTSGYNDYQYTWLAGGDNLGDVVIGRISVDTALEFAEYMAKINSLEKDININTASWLNKILLVGDTASSGISTIYTNEYVHDVSLLENPAYTYTELYGSGPSSTLINGAINAGAAFYNYRGYIGMSGWPSSMSSLFNSYKLFHAVFITCNTGTFNGSTSTTEQIVRLGTEASLGGSVTAIGMATSSTHTPMNNCLNVGIFHNIYPMGGREMGSAMLYGKLYLNAIYGVSNPSQALNFSQFCNLIGDPTAAVYVGIPNTFNVTAPASIPAGEENIAVRVKDASNVAVEGASVTLTDASGMQIIGFTDATGYVLLDVSPTQSLEFTLTVSKNDFKPAISTISINNAGGIVYDSYIADDDTATGNGDGVVNSGEEVNLYVTVKNTTSGTIFLSGEASCNDPYVTLTVFDRIEYNSIVSGGFGENVSPIVFNVAPNCPDGHQFVIALALAGSAQNWNVNIPIVVRAGNLQIQSYSFVGSTGNIVNPGNVFPLTFSLRNNGLANLTGISGILRSYDPYFSVEDSLGYFGNINVNSTVTNTANRFETYALGNCIDGMIIPLELYLYNASGYSQTLSLTLTIGQTSVTDPLGQDAYGYFIYDQGDTSYPECPSYQWIPIAPAEGGSGTPLSITDPGSASDEGDQVGNTTIQTVTLPFPFTFYGRSYTQASISANGFIAFGSTPDSDWRNWRLPGPGGPNPMIAAFWDDLQFGTGSGVYTYYNSAQHYYVVEWYNVISGYDRVTPETFQAILYDPIFYPTQTNDGQIKLQYKQFNNIDAGSGDTYPHGNFSTIGIKDHNGLVGLEYTFNNTYPTAAAPLTSLSSLFITTRPLLSDNPHIVIQQVNVLDNNSNGYLEPGETANLNIQLRNSGLTQATSVNAELSSTDAYVTINASNASYGNINAQASANPLSNFAITVAANCPAEHSITFTLTITGSGNTWIYNFTQVVHTPVLGFGTFTINDSSGNGNGSLDPGETATISISLNNTGLVASPSGTANLSCVTPGITMIIANTSFSPIAAGGSQTLAFSLRASSSMSIGTLASLVFTATAGTFTANVTSTLEIGAPTVVLIGTGTATQSYPIDRYYNYSAHEAVYLATEIGLGGTIKAIAFEKASGSDVNPISEVSIYMKNTSSSTVTTGVYSLDGYTLVYNGSFTNDAESGWMEVNLDTMFEYNGFENLSVLIVKGFEQYITNYPYWTYSSTGTSRARQNHSDTAAPTSLTATSNLPNIRVKIFPNTSALYPPVDFSVLASNRTVALAWQPPVIGTPTGYKIYRDGALFATETGLNFFDVDVVNGTTYSYYLKADYDGVESSATATLQATPSENVASTAVIGSGTTYTGNNNASPINITYKSSHGQAVYTAAELNAAGVFGPINITHIGFNVATAPNLALPNYIIRMKHTTAVNAAVWHTADGFQTVYSNASYMPTIGGYDMLTLSTPFAWNGTDNIVIDTAFGLVANWSQTGTLQYTFVSSGFRYTWNDSIDQTNVFSGGSTNTFRPNIKIGIPAVPQGATISMPTTPLNFGSHDVGTVTTQQITIQNTGTQVLAGYIAAPAGFSIAFARSANSFASFAAEPTRDGEFRFSIPADGSQNFVVSFAPTTVGAFSGNVVITSNSTTNSVLNLPVSGNSYPATLATPVVTIGTSDNDVQLQWNSVPNATQYAIYKSDTPNGTFTLIGTTALTVYTDASGVRGFYYVKATAGLPSK